MSCSEWKEYKLEDLIISYNSKRKPLSSREREGRNGIYPYYGAQGIIDYLDDYIFDGEYLLIAEDGNNLRERKEDIARIAHGRFWVNNHAHIITNNHLSDMRFLKYYLNIVDISAYITGSAQPKLNKANLNNIKIKIPSLEKQKKIAKILSSLDDKIELNNEMNKTLEEMAQSIFKRWFVDFEFPNEDGETYKSSGGEMVESELGMIPKGWEINTLNEILDTISVKHKFSNDEIIFLNTSDILDGEILHNNYSDVSSLPGQAKKSIQKGDILYSEIRPKNKRYAFIDFEADDYVVSTKLMVLRTKNRFNPSMIYFYLTNEDTVNYLQTIAEGRSGTFPQITFNELKKIKICIPMDNRIVELGNFFENILTTINNNKKEIKQLKEVRDTLLPKLINGEIDL